VKATAPRGLVPPRPNLGPEPWTDPQTLRAAPFAVLIVFLLAIATAALYGVWRRRRRAHGDREKHLVAGARDGDGTARARLIGLSGSLREALVDRFGPSYRARTVEELFADTQLGDHLGAEKLELLARFLRQVDQLKFAPERAPREEAVLEHELSDWAPRVEDMRMRIRVKAAVTGPAESRKSRRRTGRGQ
jgi:hypothetical protein